MARWGVAAAAVVAAAIVLLVLTSSIASGFPVSRNRDLALSAPGGGPMAVGDMNRDGRADFVVADAEGKSLHILSQGPYGFAAQPNTTVPLSGTPQALALADVTGDGAVDASVLGPDVVWILAGRGDGTVEPSTAIPAPGAVAFAVGELSGDAPWDIVVLTADGIDIRYFRPWALEYPALADRNVSAPGGRALAVADVNGDGRADIVLARSFEVSVYLQGAPGVLLPPATVASAVAGAEMWIEVQDVNGDGRSDISVLGSDADASNGTVQVLLQAPLSAFTASRFVSGPFSGPLAVGDLTGDGQVDIVLGRSDGDAALLPQAADGSFAFGSEGVVFETIAPARSLRVGAFHANSRGDLAIRIEDWVYIFIQEDRPPLLTRPIPSDVSVNENAVRVRVLDLRAYYADDHGGLSFQVTYQDRPTDVSASIDADGYHLSVSARPGWHGRGRFAVAAWDGVASHGPLVSNVFTITVNGVPTFTSTPIGEVTAGEPFLYQPEVRDAYPLEDVHTFEIVEGPRGMAVDAATGLVRWTPLAADVGAARVSLRVEDAFGGVALQAFTIVVFAAPTEPSVQVLAAASLSALLGGLGAGSLVSENLRYLLVNVFAPLYTKIKREQVLDHFVRGQIYGYVIANPGEHYNAIKQALGLTNGSLAHHLKTLEREEFIKSRRFGLYRRFYPINMRIPDEGYLTLNTIQRTIAELVKANPGITQKDIAGRLGLTPPTVNYHIDILQTHHVVQVVREGRATHCFVFQDAVPSPPDGGAGPRPGDDTPGTGGP